MPENEISEDVRKFLFESILSYEHLEALLLIAKNPTKEWSAENLSETLRLSGDLASDALDHLFKRRLLRQSPEPSLFLYDASSAKLVESLARLYEEQRLLIIRLMNTNAMERMRNGAITTFADAFLIARRKKSPDG